METNKSDIFFEDHEEMINCKICKTRIKKSTSKKKHINSDKHKANLLNQQKVESDKEEETIEVETFKKEFKIISSDSYNKFKKKIENSLLDGWKLHGYTQHPFEFRTITEGVCVDKEKDKWKEKFIDRKARKGQWSQAFTKNVFNKYSE